MSVFTDVQAFHDAADVVRPAGPTIEPIPESYGIAALVYLRRAAELAKTDSLRNPESVELHRIRLMLEELSETVQAIHRGDLAGTADGLEDLQYVTAGSADQLGIPLDEVHTLVHAANMAKRNPVTGKFDKDGPKIVKPVGWVAPDAAIAELVSEGRAA